MRELTWYPLVFLLLMFSQGAIRLLYAVGSTSSSFPSKSSPTMNISSHSPTMTPTLSFAEKYLRSPSPSSKTLHEFDFEAAWDIEVLKDHHRDEQHQLYGKPPPDCRLQDQVISKKYPLGHRCTYPYYRSYAIVCDITKVRKEIPKPLYYLSILAVFKNEGQIMREWLDHHLAHGVEHFYLIDDFSTDQSATVLQPYIAKGLVEIFPPGEPNLKFRQGAMYNKVFRKLYAQNETTWLAIIDLDEFLYSPQEVDVRHVLKKHEDLSVVGVNWLIFGSSGLTKQPRNVVQTFVFRGEANPTEYTELLDHYKVYRWWANTTFNDWQKSIVNTMYRVDSVDVHHPRVEGISDNLSIKRYPKNPPLILNHYIVQSKDWFMKVKATRGDVNNWEADSARNLAYFKMCDLNEERDTRLKQQNYYHGIL